MNPAYVLSLHKNPKGWIWRVPRLASRWGRWEEDSPREGLEAPHPFRRHPPPRPPGIPPSCLFFSCIQSGKYNAFLSSGSRSSKLLHPEEGVLELLICRLTPRRQCQEQFSCSMPSWGGRTAWQRGLSGRCCEVRAEEAAGRAFPLMPAPGFAHSRGHQESTCPSAKKFKVTSFPQTLIPLPFA